MKPRVSSSVDPWPASRVAGAAIDSLARAVDEQAVVIARLEQRIRALEAAPRDHNDVAVLQAMFSTFETTPFRASDVFRHAERIDDAAPLRDALLAADLDNERQLGRLLMRCARRDSIAGLVVRRHRLHRHWQIVSVSPV